MKKILPYEMKFLVPNYSCFQSPWLGGYRPPDPRSLCPLSSTEFVEPPPNKIPGYVTVICPTTKARFFCWTIVVGNNSLTKMYVYARYFSSVIQYNKVLNLWYWKDAFYAYAYVYNRTLYTCINVCTNVYAAALQATASIAFVVWLQACFLFIY
jgi:hypothetical protein